jgi:hypothetical protein
MRTDKGAKGETMKYLVAGLCLMFGASAFAGEKETAYATCKAAAQIQYGSDAIVKLSKIKRNTVKLIVIKDGKKIVSCDRATLQVTEA